MPEQRTQSYCNILCGDIVSIDDIVSNGCANKSVYTPSNSTDITS